MCTQHVLKIFVLKGLIFSKVVQSDYLLAAGRGILELARRLDNCKNWA